LTEYKVGIEQDELNLKVIYIGTVKWGNFVTCFVLNYFSSSAEGERDDGGRTNLNLTEYKVGIEQDELNLNVKYIGTVKRGNFVTFFVL
jgi:hypothetical protein